MVTALRWLAYAAWAAAPAAPAPIAAVTAPVSPPAGVVPAPFVLGSVHDLRGPVTALGLHLAMLAQPGQAPPAAVEEAKAAKARLAELNTRVSSLLESGRGGGASLPAAEAAAIAGELRGRLDGFASAMRGLRGRYAAELSERAARALPHIEESVERLLGRLREFESEAAHFSENPPPALRPVDPAEPIAAAVVLVGPLAEAKRIRIDAAAAGSPPALADPELASRMLENLLGNAVKFSPEGSVIRVAARGSGKVVVFSVTDTGPGIAPAEQDRIFEDYEQAGGVEGRRLGTGLGLGIVRRLARRQQGTVGVDSEPGRGSTFFFALPAAGEIR